MDEFRHIIPISGKDSACTAIVQMMRNPNLDYEFIFNPTEIELPPVHEWLKKVSDQLGKPIEYIGKNLDEIILDQGILPSPNARFCTRMAKIEPLEEYLSEGDAYVYYGLRSDEPSRVGYQRKSKESNIYPIYPLREMGINLPMVWRILEDRNLLTPFFEWEAVTTMVKQMMGENFAIAEELYPWEYRYMFSWRVREFNCAYCPFMRQYEFVGLLEYFPDIFWHAVEIEESTGANGYTLLQGNSLRKIAEKADAIRARRAKEVCNILSRRMQMPLLKEIVLDDLAATSCGLFCGK